MSRGARVLVATEGGRLPATALRHGIDLAGPGGALVLASVLVVPHSQPMEAALDRSVAAACEALERAERLVERAAPSFDTRLVRARSFADGLLTTLGEEGYDIVLVELGGAPGTGWLAQVQAVLDRAPVTVMLVRAAPGPVGAPQGSSTRSR